MWTTMASKTELIKLLVWIITCFSAHGATQQRIDKVHVVFMNHLDVGFDGIDPTVGFVSNVVNVYFDTYFPRAVNIVNDLINHGHKERFIYTTHSWMVYLCLYCDSLKPVIGGRPVHCPSDEEKSDFENLIRQGNITWHAAAMNFQPEYLTELLFKLNLNISTDLDHQFGISRKYSTMSQRDVPGMTQAVIPVLAEAGVAAVSVGVSSSSPPPALPNPSIWKFKENEVIAMWHKGGYPNPPGPNATFPGGLSRDDCVIVDGFSEALCFAFRGDNTGPPEDYKEVLRNYNVLRGVFPGADVTASTFDLFVEALQTVRSRLPVRQGEVGDTWIQGVGSDHLKNAKFRVFADALEQCYQKGECVDGDQRLKTAVLWLVKLGEHSWGLKGTEEHIHWANSDFAKVINNYVAVPDLTTVLPCGDGVNLQFGKDGSLVKLYDPYNAIDWAGTSNPIGQFLYRTYNETDSTKFGQQYCYRAGTTITGLTKKNMTQNAHVESKFWPYTLLAVYKNKTATSHCDVTTVLTPANSTANTYYGAPRQVWMQYVTHSTLGGFVGMDITVQMFNKPTTRLPEAVSLHFQPVQAANQKWSISKIGQIVDPMNVVLNGSQYNHATDSGVHFLNDSDFGLRIFSQDVPLVLWSTPVHPPSVYPAPLKPLTDPITGAAFNIINNVWDINYILWYPYHGEDEHLKARFTIAFETGRRQ